MNEDVNAKIEKYFSDSTFFYRFLWGNKKNLAMHFGFWDKNTKKLSDALINENRYITKELDIKKGDEVLDAGCGVGGTAIWIAENCGANVTGITITKKHISLAKKYANERGVAGLTKFELGDFCDTGLPSESFDKIYGIESVCYALDKYDFFKEAYRLLKKGGKLIVCDGFLSDREFTSGEKKYYDDLCLGWALPNLASKSKFIDDATKAGFSNKKFIEANQKIHKSSEEMYKSSKVIHPIIALMGKLHLTSKANVLAELACKAQYHMFEEGVGV
ncbi:MAG TPA: methyltransferase domain-containing protein, partial [Candidatus Saccharimonadales bacterium]|nr:methyltransferase domain-containing protein [Candidatus Saccharimonadales bacterium]